MWVHLTVPFPFLYPRVHQQSLPGFFPIPNHVKIIRELLEDWSAGERAFLLLGGQGVGKNVLCEKLLEIAHMEREFIQLHRDSTLGQITLQPTLEDGKIVW